VRKNTHVAEKVYYLTEKNTIEYHGQRENTIGRERIPWAERENTMGRERIP
jgi:hypothetical protein